MHSLIYKHSISLFLKNEETVYKGVKRMGDEIELKILKRYQHLYLSAWPYVVSLIVISTQY